MKIDEIQTFPIISRAERKEGIKPSSMQDRLSISTESEKKALWVKKLHEMPCIRPEKIETALETSPTSREIAEKIMLGYRESNLL